jgi:hypothetical protein
MRAKLGWWDESEARTQVLSRFVPVAQQIFASLAPIIEEKAPPPDVLAALAQFETWYRETLRIRSGCCSRTRCHKRRWSISRLG